MILPERMCRMDCLVVKEYADSVVSSLHHEGIVEIQVMEDSFMAEKGIKKEKHAERNQQIVELLERGRKAAEFLNSTVGTSPNMLEEMLDVNRTERIALKRLDFPQLIDYSSRAINPLESRISELQATMRELDLKTAEKKAIEEKYSPLRGIKLNSKYFAPSHYTETVLGMVHKDGLKILEERLDGSLFGRFILIKAKDVEDESVIAVSVLKEDYGKMMHVLNALRFNRIQVNIEGDFDEVLAKNNAEIIEITAERKKMDNTLRELYDEHYVNLMASLELLEIERQRCEVYVSWGSTDSVLFMRFWAPENKFNKVEELVKKHSNKHCAIVKSTDFEDAPVLLNNPEWIKPFESLTKMFSVPKYNQLDPTILLAPTFVLFFGMMFSDAVYGLALVGVAFLLKSKYGKYSKQVKDFSLMLSFFGASAIFFGLMSGSFLGDLAGKYILGSPEGSQAVALWLDPLYKGNMMIYISLVFTIGLIHVLSGYLIGGLDSVRRRQYKSAIIDYFTVIVIPIGFIVYLINGSTIAIYTSLLGILVVFVGSGLMATYIKVSGIVGSVVSYARLLALMVSSGGISMTINFMTYLTSTIPYVGLLLAPLIFAAGHTVNLALNMLGSFVHTLRLHYVEYFGTFYEGGGSEFTPFAEARRYTRIIETEVE